MEGAVDGEQTVGGGHDYLEVDAPGRWRMMPTIATGQTAAAAYERDAAGIHRAYGLGVLTLTDAGIARITVFGDGPDLVARFGLPRELDLSTGTVAGGQTAPWSG